MRSKPSHHGAEGTLCTDYNVFEVLRARPPKIIHRRLKTLPRRSDRFATWAKKRCCSGNWIPNPSQDFPPYYAPSEARAFQHVVRPKRMCKVRKIRKLR